MTDVTLLARLRAALPGRVAPPLVAHAEALLPGRTLQLQARDWASAAAALATFGARFSALWIDHGVRPWQGLALFADGGDYLLLHAELDSPNPALPSLTPHFAGAARCERGWHDLLGVDFVGHPDPRRWLRHQAWGEHEFPLAAPTQPPARTPADTTYPFTRVAGGAVHEVAVGPIHAGTIEPGYFRFATVGEQALQLELRLGYVHRGVQSIACGRDAAGLLRLAARVSGDSAVAHAWAAAMALEHAAGVTPPARALALRAVLAERERVANHLGDAAGIANDVGFSFAHVQFGALRERWQRRSAGLFGHRLLFDVLAPGGVRVDVDAAAIASLRADHIALRAVLRPLIDIVLDHPSLDDRLVGTGVLSAGDARALGCLGYVARASGQDLDVRRDAPYAPYDRLGVRVPVYTQGDVVARLRVRLDEIGIALDLLDALLADLPAGATMVTWAAPADGGTGLGIVEGWRGETVAYVRLDALGRVTCYAPRDPSVMNWPALERLLPGNIIPDFPVCNKSINGSYAGHDL
ncbi:MAG: NADH-quinone oxidoreductase subunit C [Pseudomonadota bacterium]|nr:NADH-quinone oxidoreductase subunit C [Pseudomonadota bacterium]